MVVVSCLDLFRPLTAQKRRACLFEWWDATAGSCRCCVHEMVYESSAALPWQLHAMINCSHWCWSAPLLFCVTPAAEKSLIERITHLHLLKLRIVLLELMFCAVQWVWVCKYWSEWFPDNPTNASIHFVCSLIIQWLNRHDN